MALDIAQKFRAALSMVGIEIRPSADTAGPTITSGTGAASASEPNGSVYLRTDGAAGTTVYGRASGAWVALTATDAEVTALAGLTSAADKVPYFTGVGTASVADFTGQARTFNAAGTAAAQRAVLGLDTGNSPAFVSVTANLTGTATSATVANSILAAAVPSWPEQTGTGGEQIFNHAFGSIPSIAHAHATAGHDGAGAPGTQAPVITYGVMSTTEARFTCTAGAKFRVLVVK